MTDDFHLFADPEDGGGPIDPDIALVSAYLARELSPMQVLALEERLATDASFRANMQPLIDAWAAPVPSLEHGLAGRSAPLTSLERAEGWRRFQDEGALAAPSEPIPVDTHRSTTRRISMKRIALLAGLAALPVVSFAQVVVYAANHADAPGHSIARQLVLAFTHDTAGGNPDASSSLETGRSQSSITDARVARPLTAPKVVAAESVKAAETIATTPIPTPAAGVSRQRFPDRTLIAELTRRYQPELVRGDTTTDYVVMVLDNAESYVWSTIGNGNVSINVGGDPRTPEDRVAFTIAHRDDFWGDSAPPAVGRAGRGGRGVGAGFGGRGRGMSETRIDSTPPGFGRGGRGALFATRYATGDTVYTIQYDSLLVRTTGGRGQWAYGVYALDSAGRGFGGRGRGVFGARYPGSAPGTYSAGWVGPAAGNANRAQGLEIPLQAKSGIRGLESSSVESADTYFFAPGELARSALRVMVVHLTPGASWRGPF